MKELSKSQLTQPKQPTNESVSLTLARQPDFGIEEIREISKLIATNRDIVGVRIGFDFDKSGKVGCVPGIFVNNKGYDDDRALDSALRIISQKLFPTLANMRLNYSYLNTELYCQVCDGATCEEAVRKILSDMKINNLAVISGKEIVDLAQSLKDKEIEPEQTERIKKLLFEGVNIGN